MKTLDFSDPAASEKFRHLSLMTVPGLFEAAKGESARNNPIVPTLLTVSDPPRKVAAATPHNNDARIRQLVLPTAREANVFGIEQLCIPQPYPAALPCLARKEEHFWP